MPLYSIDGISPRISNVERIFLASNADVIGNCVLGEDVSIWFGAVLRGDNESITIGDRSNIQDGSVLHTDPGFPLTVGEDCTVGHRAILHGCVIGSCSLIGMGATILNGASIGRFSLVGANALVTEGKIFPDYSLIIGSPAKIIRQLDQESVERIRKSSEHYVSNSRRYIASLRLI